MRPVPTEEEQEDADLNIDNGSDSYDSDQDEDDAGSGDKEANAEVTDDRRQMKSMGIMMGDEFLDEYDQEGSCCCCCCCGRYWQLFLCFGVLLATVFLGVQGAVQYSKQFALLLGNANLDDSAECHVYTEDVLAVVEQNFEANNDTKSFCQDAFPDCQCKHPFEAAKPSSYGPQWTEIQRMNLAQVQKYTTHMQADVALLGDSIVEHFNGLDLGYTGGAWKGNKLAFDKIFNPQLGGKISGVALGIAGDRIQNLLYRLRNGEGPAEFHPRVWWIVIGTNDLEDKCNADTIVVGHFRLVEQIRKYHPGSIIVLNSVLPRNDNRDDLFNSPTWPIIQEINLKLECYSNTARGVEFFNATDAFVAHRKGKVVVNQQFMKDPVHPNAEGTRLWGGAIADRVVELKQRKNHYHEKKNNNH